MTSFAKSAQRVGRKLAAPATKEPQLRAGLEFYMDAFIDLDSERSHGMGWTRIPWSSVWTYGVVYELDEEQMEDLVFFIARMDLAHIDQLEKKREADKGKK